LEPKNHPNTWPKTFIGKGGVVEIFWDTKRNTDLCDDQQKQQEPKFEHNSIPSALG